VDYTRKGKHWYQWSFCDPKVLSTTCEWHSNNKCRASSGYLQIEDYLACELSNSFGSLDWETVLSPQCISGDELLTRIGIQSITRMDILIVMAENILALKSMDVKTGNFSLVVIEGSYIAYTTAFSMLHCQVTAS